MGKLGIIPVDLGDVSPTAPSSPAVVEEGTIASSASGESAPAVQKFAFSNGYTYTVNHETKRIDIWLICAIWYDISAYLRLINLIIAAPAEFTLHLYIHSPGGVIPTACHILSALLKCKATVITHNLGLAASCGSLLLSGGQKIAIHPNSVTMFHGSASGGFDMSHRILSRTNHLLEYVQFMLKRMINQGLITEEEFEGITKRGEEYYLTSDVMISRLKASGLLYEGV